MKKLRKSSDDVIFGVCGGVAEWLGWDPTVVRIIAALLLVFTTWPIGLIYVILAFVLPD